MDPITQGAVGAAVAASAARRDETRWAALLGGLAGMAPDLDVLIRSSADPLFFLEAHRHFSHALSFVPVGALACAGLAWPLVRGRLSFARAFLYCLLGFATHGLLDACTSYGTHLVWPFADTRVAWRIVSVVDPGVTLPMAGLAVAAVIQRQPRWARLACAWLALLLSLGALQRSRAESHAARVAEGRGHTATRLQAKPSFGNLWLWKTLYEVDGRFRVDAVRLLARPTAFAGDEIAVLDPARDLPWLDPESRQARDLERFRRFSDGFVAIAPGEPDRVIDVRYSMVPNQIDGLWGIELDRAASPDAHVRFFTSRRPSAEERAALRRMLFQ